MSFPPFDEKLQMCQRSLQKKTFLGPSDVGTSRSVLSYFLEDAEDDSQATPVTRPRLSSKLVLPDNVPSNVSTGNEDPEEDLIAASPTSVVIPASAIVEDSIKKSKGKGLERVMVEASSTEILTTSSPIMVPESPKIHASESSIPESIEIKCSASYRIFCAKVEVLLPFQDLNVIFNIYQSANVIFLLCRRFHDKPRWSLGRAAPKFTLSNYKRWSFVCSNCVNKVLLLKTPLRPAGGPI